VPGKIYPNEKKKLIDSLTPRDLRIIQKDYPFKNLRNAKIFELMQAGVSCSVLSKLPGTLSKSAIHRIGQFAGDIEFGDDESLKKKLIKIKAAVKRIDREIKKYIKQKGGGINHGRTRRKKTFSERRCN
jgi:hypothetical protein